MPSASSAFRSSVNTPWISLRPPATAARFDVPVFRHLFRWFATRRFDDGSISVLAVMGAVPLLALGAVLADSGRTLAERLALQSAVEAAALSGAYEQLAADPVARTAACRYRFR